MRDDINRVTCVREVIYDLRLFTRDWRTENRHKSQLTTC